MLAKWVVAALATAIFSWSGRGSTPPSQFASTAAIQGQISNFERTLVTRGVVDYSTVPGISSEILNAQSDAPKNRPLSGTSCFEGTTAAPIVNPCVYTNPKSKDTVVLFGDSHAFQYLNAFVKVAQRRGVRLVTFTRAACGAAQSQSTADVAYLPYQPNCNKWRLAVLAALRVMVPNEIVFSQDVNGLPWKLGPIGGFETSISHSLSGIVKGHRPSSVVALVDNVSASYAGWGANSLSTAACLARNGLKSTYESNAATATWHNDTLDCYRVYSNNIFDVPLSVRQQLVASDLNAGITEIDPRPWMCDVRPKVGLCPPLIDGTLVYQNQGHLTASFTERLITVINAALPIR